MAFSYEASVILLSFAIFGIWCFFKNLWEEAVLDHRFEVPKITFFILVKNIEQDIEEMLRHIAYEIEKSGFECEVIVVDHTSDDLTFPIAKRLAREYYPTISVYDESKFNNMKLSLLYCGGNVIHVIDMIKHVEVKAFIPLVSWLLRGNRKSS